ncbi:MAG: glycosyl hydrolase 53 family protein [Pseudothermotoga sp.]
MRSIVFLLILLTIPFVCGGIMRAAEDFIVGVDLSMLYEIERLGGKFYENGQQRDCLEILKNKGVNWVRLRVWNDPTDENGKPLGGGNCSRENMAQVAKRAKVLGMKVLLDFHYSDWWADPGKQNKPKAWKDLHGEDLKRAIYEYTKDVLSYMKEQDASPDMVQVGNEVNNGFLWPDGLIVGAGAGGFEGFTELLKEAIKAVREFDPKIAVMIHLAEGGNNQLFRWFFDEMIKRNVDFDVIGVSFYPYWHGTLEDLKENLNDLAKRYGKKIIIAETAYAWTLLDADGHPNIFGHISMAEQAGYLPTIQGQRTFLAELAQVIRQVPDDLGVGFFYWEGAWIPIKGAGWKTNEGNPWENQALFYFNGDTLPSLDVFSQILKNEVDLSAEVLQVDEPSVETAVGKEPQLPEEVRVVFSNDAIKILPVVWDYALPEEMINKVGEHYLRGTLSDGTELRAKITVKGSAPTDTENYIENPSFETKSLEPWKVEGDTNAVKVVIASPPVNAHSGKYALNYWLDRPFKFTLYQTIELPNGIYKLSFWIHGGGGENHIRLTVSEYGGEEKTLQITNTGWLKWNNPTIDGIEVTNGKIKIELDVDANSGNWAWIDDFLLLKTE